VQDKSKKGRIALALVICALMLIMGAFFWMRRCNAQEKVDGKWSCYYYYSNDSSLVYKGTVHVQLEDSLSAKFEIYAPKSKRAEVIAARELTYNSAQRTLSGVLVHDRYKIREGHLLEEFSLVFEDQGQFSGVGRCKEYCAEGTEDAEITWMGMREISD